MADHWQPWPSVCGQKEKSGQLWHVWWIAGQSAHNMAKTWVSPHCSSTWNPSVTPPGTEKRQSPELGFEALLWGPRLSIISFTTSPPTAPLQLPLCHTLHLRFRTFCLYSHNLFTTYNLTQITAFPINLSYDPAVLLVDIHPKEMKVSSKQVQWDVQRSMFIPALFTTVKIWSQPKCPSVGEQINPPPPKKQDVVYMQNRILCSHE